jgi:hypothetical protein
MRISGAALFTAAVAAAAAYAILTAVRWPPKAGLFPLVMSIPLFVLALTQLALELLGRAPAVDASPGGRAALTVLGWMAGFIALVFLLGFPFAVPLFIFGYLVIAGRERWPVSLALALLAWGAFYLLFQKLLHFPFEAGLLTGGGT